MRLTLASLYQARWSADVHDEWIRSVLRDHPHIPPARLHDLRAAMDEHAEESVVTGYSGLIASLNLPNPDDRHVLAAAITSGSDVIVTGNLQDFPKPTLQPYGIEAQHPDDFISHLLSLAADAVLDAVINQQTRLINPPITMAELLTLFEKLGLTKTAKQLRALLAK